MDADVCARADRAPLDVVHAFLGAGAKLIQLRCKTWGSGAFLDLARQTVAAAAAVGATVIINDRADIAVLSGAQGLHIGQEDLRPADARRVIGDEPILGLSTHTPAQWEAAVEEPVSYVAIGPVFGTATKDTGYAAVGLGVVAQAVSAAASRGLPVVAIGGIGRENAASVIAAGAASVAVITDLVRDDPAASCHALLAALA